MLAAMRLLLQGPQTSNMANESREAGDLCQNFFQASLYLELHQDAILNSSLSSQQILFFKENSIIIFGFQPKEE